jgi:hypothetical protein
MLFAHLPVGVEVAASLEHRKKPKAKPGRVLFARVLVSTASQFRAERQGQEGDRGVDGAPGGLGG